MGMDAYLLTRFFLVCLRILYNVDAKYESTPGWWPYIDFHLQQPLQEYYLNGRDTLISRQKGLSTIFSILERYVRFSKQRCDISFCKSPCSYQDRSWHTITTTWPCGALCHDSINKTASCEWRMKLNSRMRLNITVLNMQIPYGSFDRLCNRYSIKLVEGVDRPRTYHWCNSMYNVMTRTETGDVTIRMYVLPEWCISQVFSALYQVVDPIHGRYMQMEEEQIWRGHFGRLLTFSHSCNE